ncbi:hypothetical protein IGI04_036789, partial [Brassica rapa subsp. trilocularis]
FVTFKLSKFLARIRRKLNSAYWTAGEVQVTNAFDALLILFNPELPEALALTNVYDSKQLDIPSFFCPFFVKAT